MTETLTAQGTLLAADPGARTVTYRLLPYGEQGRTSRGLVTASSGSVTIPDPSSVVLNMEHDRTRPLGRASAIVEDSSGLVATFTVADTTAGNDLLAETAAGLRPGVSVELDAVVIRHGALVSSTLVAAGAVVAPAFPSALLVATDTPPDPLEPDPVGDPADDTTPDEDSDGDETGDTMPDETTTASAPAAAPAALLASAQNVPALTFPRVAQLLAQRARGAGTVAELTAALADITSTASGAAEAPQWIDEVWSGSPYARQIVPLIAHGQLTGLHVTGWTWTVPPEGGDYAGDKAAVPSNAAVTAPVDLVAGRFAGAHDVDRAFYDFGDASFWSSYWTNQAKSYGKWSDGKAAAGLVAAAPVVVPAGTGVVAAVVAAALAVIPTGSPTFVLAGAAAFAELVERDPLAFLSGSLSLSSATGDVGGLTIRASSYVPADTVLVGVRDAATWYELGETPIRAETVNIPNGGIDVGAFGYGVVGINEASGLAKAVVTQPLP